MDRLKYCNSRSNLWEDEIIRKNISNVDYAEKCLSNYHNEMDGQGFHKNTEQK